MPINKQRRLTKLLAMTTDTTVPSDEFFWDADDAMRNDDSDAISDLDLV